MTNAPEGRTYIDHQQTLRMDAQSYFDSRTGGWCNRAEDIIETKIPHVVANGKWVLEVPRPHKWAWPVGEDTDKHDFLRFTDEYGSSRALFIGDKPFGFVFAEEEDVDQTVYPPVPTGRRRLVCARQIHKGELGRSIPFERLPYVRQAFEKGQKPNVTRPRERRRGYGWVRLIDLVDATGLSYEEVVFGYWDYSGHRSYENGQSSGQLLDIVWASFEEDIKGEVPSVLSLTRSDAETTLMAWKRSRIWVRRGFAYTVLRLQTLGVQPYAMQAQPV